MLQNKLNRNCQKIKDFFYLEVRSVNKQKQNVNITDTNILHTY